MLFKMIKKLSPQTYHSLMRHITGLADNSKLPQLQASDYIRRHLHNNPEYADPKCLNRFEYSCYSQNGEDGILEEIFRRIGETNRQFVEFGVQDGVESNSAYLLVKGWTGLWIEGSVSDVKKILKNFKAMHDKDRLQVKNAFVTAENLDGIIEHDGIETEFDLLSIDIDGNDYWVWKGLSSFRPRVVMTEYNAIFKPPVKWVMPYHPGFVWDGTSYFGASLASLDALGNEKGYRLVGCDFTGVNAFFVREDLVGDNFAGPLTAEHLWQPPRYFLCRTRSGHPRKFGDFETV